MFYYQHEHIIRSNEGCWVGRLRFTLTLLVLLLRAHNGRWIIPDLIVLLVGITWANPTAVNLVVDDSEVCMQVASQVTLLVGHTS